MMNKIIKSTSLAFIITISIIGSVQAQVEYRWLAYGSLHNFYSNIGSEIETGFIDRQQAGFTWPGIYEWQDAQAAKGMWIGVTNWTDELGSNFPVRVLHVGPRVRGEAFFFPMEFKTFSKFPVTDVLVDGVVSARVEQIIDEIDPNIPSDRKIYSKINTALGITMERSIYQFSQQYHDNYHLIELVFTNTGNTDKDADIELPNQTITGFYYHEQNRWSPVLQVRYTIGNGTGWGMQTMNDRRGDGLGGTRPDDPNDPTENEFSAQFAWHGKFAAYSAPIPNADDNVGGPLIVPSTVNGLLSSADTTGRLGAYHFVGKVHVYADSSATLKIAATAQPSTMDEIDSDDNLTSNNDSFNVTRMQTEYARMSVGRTQRHAYLVESTGFPGFVKPTKDPTRGGSGGYSAATGYGPYTLAPGESIKIVYAEAVSGIGHPFAKEVGSEYKRNIKTGMDKDEARRIKNTKMFQGRDSLFQTFRNVIANYNSNFQINQPPPAPSYFEVSSTGAGIKLFWDFEASDESKISGFEVYRSAYRTDSTAKLIATLDPSEREMFDDDRTPAAVGGPPIRGIDYYYYVSAVGKPADNADGIYNPTGALKSTRYATQTYDPARLLRPPGESLSEVRIVPNPYIASVRDQSLLFTGGGGGDRIAFFDVPGNCSIKIFTELGEFVNQLPGTNSGDIFWDLFTKSRQRIASGIYIAIIENLDTGEKITKKFVVIF